MGRSSWRFSQTALVVSASSGWPRWQRLLGHVDSLHQLNFALVPFFAGPLYVIRHQEDWDIYKQYWLCSDISKTVWERCRVLALRVKHRGPQHGGGAAAHCAARFIKIAVSPLWDAFAGKQQGKCSILALPSSQTSLLLRHPPW